LTIGLLKVVQRWSMPKKYWQLTLLALYACGFSYGENNLGAARAVISREANVPLTALAGGGALNYLLLVSYILDQRPSQACAN
jgi:hypothetical protein